MNNELSTDSAPRFGLGALVTHPMFGTGRVVAFEGHAYVMVFKGGDTKRVSFAYEGLQAAGEAGDPALDQIKQAVLEVLGDHGWVDVEIELARRWSGGKVVLVPGKADTQSKDIPLEAFFKKLIGVREKLRVLEQKINNHPSLNSGEKLELEAYITRCYGSLTSFNVLFSSKEGQFKGSGKAVSGDDPSD